MSVYVGGDSVRLRQGVSSEPFTVSLFPDFEPCRSCGYVLTERIEPSEMRAQPPAQTPRSTTKYKTKNNIHALFNN